jgi:DNA-binding response OmpR family regulator
MSEQKIRILLAEDDENLGSLLKEYLQVKSYETDWTLDGEAAYDHFRKKQYDILILDIMMPKKDGFTLAREIRMINREIPVIFLTAKSMKEDVLEGFSIGADDYITKPFSMEELLYRIEAILRRTKPGSKNQPLVYTIGQYKFDTQKQLLIFGDQPQKLTTKESDLLRLLWQAGKDEATKLELAAWRAEQDGDPKRAKSLEDAAQVLDNIAEQDFRALAAMQEGEI